LIGCRKIRARTKTIAASSGSAEEVRKKLMIVHNKEKKGMRLKLRKKVTLLGYREIRYTVGSNERQQEKYRKAKKYIFILRGGGGGRYYNFICHIAAF
jgi:hypothetical protein